ncbi:MAG: hypothetical protein LKJ21_00755 [Oscillospiraceae bacterium]|jgi:hypothetical protein|nr:hypothetical protein [Oscillospiraceae bacterium]MCI1989735.1 hypothetical protein [Oscillospiraceae bacterium]MCI2034338.1 hypothetical protein [Oscillospiraceae bacterium]
MEQKNLRQTNGAPLYLGIAGAVLLLVNVILSSGVSTAYVNSVYATAGLAFTMSQTVMLALSLVFFVIYPGIFLILLLVGANKPRRGTAFAVVWIVFSGLGTLSALYSLFASNAQIRDLSNQLVPGGFYLYSILGLIGQVCVLVSCILLLKRLHTPPEQPQNLEAANP